MGSAVAFFDVDDTLTRNGMVSFLSVYQPLLLAAPMLSDRVENLLALQASGASRAVISTEYFRLFVGESWAHLISEGERWMRGAENLFIPPVLAALRTHQDAGDKIVLVSGSFSPLVVPVATAVNADWVRTTPLDITGGIVVGTSSTMVGEAKATAAREAATAFSTDLADCTAYGDHESDLPLLEAVGHPVLVIKRGQKRSDLQRLARRRHWKVIAH